MTKISPKASEIVSYIPRGGWFAPEDVRRYLPQLGRHRPYRELRRLSILGALQRRGLRGGRVEYRKPWGDATWP